MMKAKEAAEKRKVEMTAPVSESEFSSYGVEDYDEEDSVIDEKEEETEETTEVAAVN